jgi:hypothetical protein
MTDIPFSVGWGFIHLGLIPLVGLVAGVWVARANFLAGLAILSIPVFWTFSSVTLLGWDWFIAGSIVFWILSAICIRLLAMFIGMILPGGD